MKNPKFIRFMKILAVFGFALPGLLIAEPAIRVDAERGKAFTTTRTAFLTTIKVTPHFAVWLEKPDGTFIKTVYVSLKKGRQDYWVGNRPHPLPVWAARCERLPLTDALTGASTLPPSPARLSWTAPVPAGLESVVVRVELNLAFDHNKAWPELPQELWGQPSLIYGLPVSTAAGLAPAAKAQALVLLGRSDGPDGTWIADLGGIDTARDILARVTALFVER